MMIMMARVPPQQQQLAWTASFLQTSSTVVDLAWTLPNSSKLCLLQSPLCPAAPFFHHLQPLILLLPCSFSRDGYDEKDEKDDGDEKDGGFSRSTKQTTRGSRRRRRRRKRRRKHVTTTPNEEIASFVCRPHF
jgi:hypothetical protein